MSEAFDSMSPTNAGSALPSPAPSPARELPARSDAATPISTGHTIAATPTNASATAATLAASHGGGVPATPTGSSSSTGAAFAQAHIAATPVLEPRAGDEYSQMFAHREWLPMFDQLLTLFEHSSSGDATRIREVFNSVTSTHPFQQHVDRNFASQFYKQFLPTYIADYASSVLPRDTLAKLMEMLRSYIDQSLGEVFKSGSTYTTHIHSNLKSARIFALQMALHERYPTLSTSGLASLSRQPVYYVTEGCPLYRSVDRTAWELLTSKTCFRVIPLRQTNLPLSPEQKLAPDGGVANIATYAMDVEALEREIKADQDGGRLPCAVLATFGADLHQSSPYQCDDVAALRTIADRYNLWLHVEGASLLLAATSNPPPFVASVFESANSICAEPNGWFNLQGSLAITMVRVGDRPSAATSPSTPITRDQFSNTFQLWFHFASHHAGYLTAAVEQQLKVCAHAVEVFSSQDYPVLLGPAPTSAPPSPSAAAAAGSTRARIESAHPHVIFFQIGSPSTLNLADFNLDTNSFNKWIYQRLLLRIESQRNQSAVHRSLSTLFETSISQTSYQGRLGFLFHPLTSAACSSSLHVAATPGDVDRLVAAITYEIELIAAAAVARVEFEKAIAAEPELRLVPPDEVPNVFVGVGALRFKPSLTTISPAHVDELNAILVHNLAKVNPMFVGAVTGGREKTLCTVIQTGEAVRREGYARQLVQDIVDASKRLEFPREVTEALSKVVLKGIQEAELKRSEANSEAYRPTALIRHVTSKLPVVGRMFNWFMPPPASPEPTGHRFDIRSETLVQVAGQAKKMPLLPIEGKAPLSVPATPTPKSSSSSSTPVATPTAAAAAAAAAATAGATPAPATPAAAPPSA